MVKRAGGALLLAVALDHASARPISTQLYVALRELMLSGRIVAKTRLPASRALASDLGVSRTTVIEAFERFGCTDAFHFTFKIAELAQTPDTIEWAISVLQQTDDKTEANRDFKHHLGQLLCNADPGRPRIERTCVNSRRTDHHLHSVRRLICCPVE